MLPLFTLNKLESNKKLSQTKLFMMKQWEDKPLYSTYI